MSDTPARELTSTSADLLTPPSAWSRRIIDTIAGLTAAALIWAYLTPVSEVATGQGKVVPDKYLQSIQSAEGGYVQAIFARSGDRVEKGDTILRIDASGPGSNKEETAQQLAAAIASSVRLRALLDNKRPEFPDDLLRRFPEAVERALAQYEADRAELGSGKEASNLQSEQKQIEYEEARERLKTLKKAVTLTKEELQLLKQLYAEKAASRAELIAAESKYNELLGSRKQLELALPRLKAAATESTERAGQEVNAFRAKAAAQLAEVEVKIAAFKAGLAALQDRVARTEIKAPTSGVLKTVNVRNIGQVVKPFDIVAEIVPESDSLIIEAKIRPEDVGFIAKGMPAIIKLSAYDYSIFGSVKGTLERIAADSTTDERGNTYYAVDVRASKAHIDRRGERWEVKPGMVATVEIETGRKTVFQYLTKPLHRMATMALRER